MGDSPKIVCVAAPAAGRDGGGETHNQVSLGGGNLGCRSGNRGEEMPRDPLEREVEDEEVKAVEA